MFNNLKIGPRLGLGFGLVLILLSIISLLGISRLADFNQSLEELANNRYPKMAETNEIAFRVMDNTRIIRNIILLNDDNSKTLNKENYEKNSARIKEILDKLEQTIKSDEGKELLKTLIEARTAFRSYTEGVIQLGLSNKRDEAAKVLYGENYKTQAAYFAAIKKLVEFQENQVAKSTKSAAENYLWARNMMLALSVAAFLLGFTIAFGVTRSITKPLGAAVDVVNQLAAGDLTARIKVNSKDEVGMLLVAMQNMVGKLKAMIAEVSTSANRVSTTATQLSSSSVQVANVSQQQSESASNMASAVEEMTVSIDQVSENAQKARDASRHSGEMSARGAEVIQNAAVEMTKIEDSVREFSQIIESLEQQSGEISSIVNVIKEIADQTNLLALNAAIEAARAGEQGRGFAVVADEVRKLAERTGLSTQEIASMIGKIQSGTRDAVASIESGVARVSSGVALANQAGQSITEINVEAALVAQVVEDISNSIREQSLASNDIARNVEKIAQMTEENSAAVQQTASAAKQLEQLALSLQNTISCFKV